MAKKYDAAGKHLLEIRPQDWLTLAGFPVPQSPADLHIVDADLSGVITTAADKLIRVNNPSGGGGSYLAHIEFQSGADPTLDLRVLRYNVLSRYRHNLPVWSAVFLLRPQAWTRGITGRVSGRLDSVSGIDFAYHLIRVWELPAKSLLNSGIGVLPLATIADVAPEELGPVLQTIQRRLAAEESAKAGNEILLATKLLMGLRYSGKFKEQLMQSLLELRDSETWQFIFGSGKVEGQQQLVLRQGTERFGNPPPEIVERLTKITNSDELGDIAVRLLTASNWTELFGK